MIDYKLFHAGGIHTIQLSVEISNLDEEDTKVITLPCDLRAELDNYYDYIILACCPDIPLRRNDDIKRLNDVLDEINSENPGMTEDYLDVLIEASASGDLFDDEFIRRVRENDFIFEDISYMDTGMSAEETAAMYLATDMNVPFERGMQQEAFIALSDETVSKYINWDLIWDHYRSMGFRVVERRNPIGCKSQKYIVHIR